MILRVKGFLLPLAAGVALAAAFTASPLTVVALPLAWAAITLTGRGLPDDERRIVTSVLWVALGARLAAIAALFLIGLPGHSDASVGGLSGDDAYYFSRAIRARDLLLGFAAGKYDYFVVADEYGQTSYLGLLTWLQVAAGPTPYGMRVVNAVMFIAGAGILFRTVRAGFGAVPAIAGVTVLVLLPSLFAWSISLLKESMFFLLTAVVIGSTMRLLTRPVSPGSLGLVLLAVISLVLLDDLRRAAGVLAGAGIALGVVLRLVLARPARAAIAGLAVIGAVAAGAQSEAARSRFLDGVNAAAGIHMGHVYTVGHAYKLMDEAFYVRPGRQSPMTLEQSLRFVARGAASFVLTPLPWQIRTRGELALLPEHMLWYVMLALAPIGCVAGWRRSPWLTSILAGYALPMAAVIALTNGNVGTLVRLRALVTPQLIWIGTIGVLAVMAILIERRRITSSAPEAAAI
jgi:hypothetical protein